MDYDDIGKMIETYFKGSIVYMKNKRQYYVKDKTRLKIIETRDTILKCITFSTEKHSYLFAFNNDTKHLLLLFDGYIVEQININVYDIKTILEHYIL